MDDADYTAGQRTQPTGRVTFEPAVTNFPTRITLNGLSASQCEAMILELTSLRDVLALVERRALAGS